MITTTQKARSEFAAIADAAGTSIEVMLKQAADNASKDGEAALMDIEHDEKVVKAAEVRIQRSKIALKQATRILNLVRRYVS